MDDYLLEKEKDDSLKMGIAIGMAIMFTLCMFVGAMIWAVLIEKEDLSKEKEQVKIERQDYEKI